MGLKVGINGAGRIGRALVRILREDPAVELCSINDVAGADLIAPLLAHDSVHGPFPDEVEPLDGALRVGDLRLPLTTHAEPSPDHWNEKGVDLVVEATGHFADGERARGHVGGSVRRVLVTAVCPGADETIVLGVHDGTPRAGAEVISTASCTTHAAALPLSVAYRAFGVVSGQMTTVHCTTGSQHTMDAPHRDPRRARSSLLSMIPTTTSAGRGLAESLGPLGERISCLAVRVPTATVSLVELVLEVARDLPDSEALRDVFREASERSDLAGRLGCTEEPLVSIDFRGDSRSSIVDLPLVERCGPRLMRAIAWYDNEWGYASRVAELIGLWARPEPGESK